MKGKYNRDTSFEKQKEDKNSEIMSDKSSTRNAIQSNHSNN